MSNDKQNNRQKEKLSKFEEWMQGDHLLIHLNATAEGVHVPEHLAENTALTLKLSYLFQGETTHDDTAITSYLKFGNNYHECVIPWNCVWGMTSDKSENVMWPDDLPRGIVIKLAKARVAEFGKKIFGSKKDAQESGQVEEKKESSGEKKKPHLRRIK